MAMTAVLEVAVVAALDVPAVHRRVGAGGPNDDPVNDGPVPPGWAHWAPRRLPPGGVLEMRHGDPLALLLADSRVVVRG